MRLLLDGIYPPAATERLRARGVDASSVKESPELVGMKDGDLLAAAAEDARILVAEIVADFAVPGRSADHLGIVFCHPMVVAAGRRKLSLISAG